VSGDQRPFAERYSPTDVGLTSRFDVPSATQELSVVHATLESGTEMLIAGRPLTLGDFVTVEVAHDANTTPADPSTHHRGRTMNVRGRYRFIASL